MTGATNRNARMRQRWLTLLLPGILCLGAACALMSKPVTLAPVGPDPYGRPTSGPMGFLEVYTTVKCYPYDRQWYYAHTAYGVYGPDDKRVKSVGNDVYMYVVEPEVVDLPPGWYSIVGWADGNILVRVPVLIEAGRLTQVNLETKGKASFTGPGTNNLVRMDDGRIVGWPADRAASPPAQPAAGP